RPAGDVQHGVQHAPRSDGAEGGEGRRVLSGRTGAPASKLRDGRSRLAGEEWQGAQRVRSFRSRWRIARALREGAALHAWRGRGGSGSDGEAGCRKRARQVSGAEDNEGKVDGPPPIPRRTADHAPNAGSRLLE